MTCLLELNPRAFAAVYRGQKRVEIRINTRAEGFDYGLLAEGDRLVFCCGGDLLTVGVGYLRHYTTVERLLRAEGTRHTLSSTDVLEDGVRSVLGFPGYAEGERQNGVFALGLSGEPVLLRRVPPERLAGLLPPRGDGVSFDPPGAATVCFAPEAGGVPLAPFSLCPGGGNGSTPILYLSYISDDNQQLRHLSTLLEVVFALCSARGAAALAVLTGKSGRTREALLSLGGRAATAGECCPGRSDAVLFGRELICKGKSLVIGNLEVLG